MLGAVDVGLFYVDHDPGFRAASSFKLCSLDHAGGKERIAGYLGWVEHVGGSVDVEPYGRLIVVEKDQADVRVVQDIAHAGQHAVAPIFRVGQRLLIEHLYESRRTGPKGTIALTPRIGRCDEDHFHPGDELLHLLIQVVQQLIGVKRSGSTGSAEAFLRPLFAR